MAASKIPVVDLFAGPGGLGEGFASHHRLTGEPTSAFRIVLSVEKDQDAHETLRLRSFFRQFQDQDVPKDYYRFVRGEISRNELEHRHASQFRAANQEAWCEELGSEGVHAKLVEQLRREFSRKSVPWVLIGGPPCQAYSLVGRSRRRGIKGYEAKKDARHYLYREYLRLIADLWPAAFVMENVKGLLSARVGADPIFDRIQEDLKDPGRAISKSPRRGRSACYDLYSLNAPSLDLFGNPEFAGFTIRMEDFGIPQARHRVIILGIREDISGRKPAYLELKKPVPLEHVVKDLPRLRSGLSKSIDGEDEWRSVLVSAKKRHWYRNLRNIDRGDEIRQTVDSALDQLARTPADRGGRFVESRRQPPTGVYRGWFGDKELGGVLNHETRGHREDDLDRYLFAAAFAAVHGRSPLLSDFPSSLLPEHANASRAVQAGALFSDRFRVQLRDRPATTVTSHISKDGHYYIHYDPSQCRSLTVREAARIQTFPDNYFFCGPRTSQYVQVGNAVPPLCAAQIASIVRDVLCE